MSKTEFTTEEIAKAATVIVDGDHGEMSLTEYLKTLLGTLWEEAEGFSGKRPFGNGGWQFDVYVALIKAGLVAGTLDSQGYVEKVDTREADALVFAVIKRLA
jgi:hypothetical protein